MKVARSLLFLLLVSLVCECIDQPELVTWYTDVEEHQIPAMSKCILYKNQFNIPIDLTIRISSKTQGNYDPELYVMIKLKSQDVKYSQTVRTSEIFSNFAQITYKVPQSTQSPYEMEVEVWNKLYWGSQFASAEFKIVHGQQTQDIDYEEKETKLSLKRRYNKIFTILHDTQPSFNKIGDIDTSSKKSSRSTLNEMRSN